MSTILELECIYNRVSRPLGCNGFLGFILGDTRSVFKILLTCRSDRPGGRLWEANVVLDRYLELTPHRLYCISGCYTLCTLRGQRKLFTELKKILPLDKYSVGRNESTWLIYQIDEYKVLSEDSLRDPDRIVVDCPSVDFSYIIGWKNYIVAHPEVSDINSRLKNIVLKIRDIGV